MRRSELEQAIAGWPDRVGRLELDRFWAALQRASRQGTHVAADVSEKRCRYELPPSESGAARARTSCTEDWT